MRILLTGCSGFIGQHLCNGLLACGHEVVCAVRHPTPSSNPHLRAIAADFSKDTDKNAWLARLEGIDAVINAVGIFRETAGQSFAALHTDTPGALFAACAQTPGIELVIQLSALGADRDAATAYHLSKKAADDFLVALPLRSHIVQPSLVYGKGGASARAFKTLASLPLCLRFGSAPQLVQPVHVDDVVAAIVALVQDTARDAPQRIALVGPEAMEFTAYLAALRSALGMGRLRVLRLPDRAASIIAQVGRFLPGALLDDDALSMLNRGNTADPAAITQLLGHPPRPVRDFITDPAAERVQAKLDWLLPVLRWSIAAVWIFTALVSAVLYPVDESYRLLARTGVPAGLQPLMLYGAAAFDLALGIGTLWLARRRWLWRLQLGLIAFYSVLIAWRLPEFLWHPYGPLTKNLPMLAAIWLLYELEKD
ncbi:MAG: short chain dehydrogenase [Massilia sp.]|nr:short chain dehydrogenase [Massilia sp.]